MLAILAVAGALACAVTPLRAVDAAGAGRTPAAPVVLRNVVLDGSGTEAVTADIWRQQVRPARRPTLHPVALLVHGGGWHSGDKRQWERGRWAQRLAARGWVVVSVNYRLACDPIRDPILCGHDMSASIADVRAALTQTARRARSWGGDADRLVLFGASAGAQLAMLAASTRDAREHVRAVIALSPPVDLEWVGARPDLPLYSAVSRSLGCEASACPDTWRAASPAAAIDAEVTPATWIFDAGSDPITPIAPVRDYVAALRSAGIPVAMITTADPGDGCHGPQPCAGAALTGAGSGDLFERSQAWLRMRL